MPPFFCPEAASGEARSGAFLHPSNPNKSGVPTPVLFPVANLLTGTTPRGGGVWKYVLRHLFQHHIAFMTQALQFLDFSLTPAELERWIGLTGQSVLERYLDHYRTEHPELGITGYKGLVFMDSGGYKLLANPNLDLTRYGIPRGRNGWRGTLRIQRALGGHIYTSLDYPFRQGLVNDEADALTRQSLGSAISVLRSLRREQNHSPFFAPCHGRTAGEIQHYVSTFFARAKAEGLLDDRIGIAIGSLVPLRTIQRDDAILELVRGAIAGIPESLRPSTPVHLFGITGSIIPLLVSLGVDSFDSSAYIQNARSLEYFVPDRAIRTRFLELEGESLPCTCPHCSAHSYGRLHSVLVGDSQEDLTKSQVYATIALHNLHWDFALVDQTRTAVESGTLEDFLVEHAARYSAIRPAVELLSHGKPTMVAKLSRRHFLKPASLKDAPLAFPPGPIDLEQYDPGIPPWLGGTAGSGPSRCVTPAQVRQFSLKYTPDSFSIPSTWTPPEEKDLLLVLPCSGSKPYKESHSHRAILEFLTQRLGSVGRIQKVTLSGLYGPVPEEYEEHPAVLGYDFRLSLADESQIQLCTTRLVEFLNRYGDRFLWTAAYVTSRAYRDVVRRTASLCRCDLTVLPCSPPKQQLTELFRREHLDQLARSIEREVSIRAARSPKSTLA